MEASEKDRITANFQDNTYSLLGIPDILFIDMAGVHVKKDGPHLDAIEALDKKISCNTILTPKLKADFAGDCSLFVGIIKMEYFKSREEMEVFYSQEWEYSTPIYPNRRIRTFKRIPFQNALRKHLWFTISCNMDYYLTNVKEMEKDLNRKLENFDPENYLLLKQLEKELFFNLSIKIFGEENDEEEKANSTVFFRDFRVLFEDGNDKFATAKRGDNYLIFSYQY